MSEAPMRIWVQWPHVNGAGLAFSCNARPPARRTEYVRADEIERLQAELREARGIEDIYIETLARIKETDEGRSKQPISDIIRGAIDEIRAFPDTSQ